eukprot:scaffold975_cov63-Phaeocystis_antarctica.AAC.7
MVKPLGQALAGKRLSSDLTAMRTPLLCLQALWRSFSGSTTNRMLQGRTRTGPKPVNLRSRALPVVGARRVEVAGDRGPT